MSRHEAHLGIGKQLKSSSGLMKHVAHLQVLRRELSY